MTQQDTNMPLNNEFKTRLMEFLSLADTIHTIASNQDIDWDDKHALIFPNLKEQQEMLGIDVSFHETVGGGKTAVRGFDDAMQARAKAIRVFLKDEPPRISMSWEPQ